MKNIVLLLFLCIVSSLCAQEKYITKKGTINFEASVPSFEEVKAKNETVTAILNIDNGEFAALALIKGFRFKNALMEEHFNENYIESDEYPKATFKGKLIGFDKNNIQDAYNIKGTLTLHGKSKELQVAGNLSQENDAISISSSFSCKPADFGIKIPGIVSKKIAEDIRVMLDVVLKKK